MANPKGKVFRCVYPESGLPRTEWRTRDIHALFTVAEWGWAQDSNEAWVFDRFIGSEKTVKPDPNASAEDHVAALREEGEEHAHAFVYGQDAKDRAVARVREKREATNVMRLRDSLPSEDVAADLERRKLF